MNIQTRLGFDPAAVVAAAIESGRITRRETSNATALLLRHEMTLKEFCAIEAQRRHVRPHTVRMRIARRRYEGFIATWKVKGRVLVTVLREPPVE